MSITQRAPQDNDDNNEGRTVLGLTEPEHADRKDWGMGYRDPELSYAEMLEVFEHSLSEVLADRPPPHDAAMFTIPVLLALLEVANASREGRATESPIARATEAFATYAADFAFDDAAWKSGAAATPSFPVEVTPRLNTAS